MVRFVEDRVIGFERSSVVRHNQQCGPLSAQPRDLQISRIFADIRIIKRTLRVGFIERTVVEHIVEDHRDTEGPDLDRLVCLVLQSEPEHQMSLFQCPLSRDLQWNISR